MPPSTNAKVVERRSSPSPLTLQHKFVLLKKELESSLIDKGDDIALTLTALCSRTSVLFVGPPGSAKTLLLESIAKTIKDANVFTYLMGKFTEPDDIFGPIDITSLKAGKRKRITKGKLPEAHFGLLDEIWKSSTAILNSLLRIVNEKVYDAGEGEVKVPLRLLVSASNEWPQDQELGAIFDRFVLRKKTGYVNSPKSRRRLMNKMDHSPKVSVSFTLTEIDEAFTEAMLLPFPEKEMDKAANIVEECITQGVLPSDRRLPLLGKVVRAYAYIHGASEVKTEHLEVLSHMLWSDPTEGPKKTAQIVNRIAVPLKTDLQNLENNAQDVVNSEVKDKDARLTIILQDITRLHEISKNDICLQTWDIVNDIRNDYLKSLPTIKAATGKRE